MFATGFPATQVSTGRHCDSYTKFLDFVLGPGGLPIATYQLLPDSSVHRELPSAASRKSTVLLCSPRLEVGLDHAVFMRKVSTGPAA